MPQTNESLLRAWLHLSTSVVNDRVVSELSFNEALICNILYRASFTQPERNITATDLCNETKMLKSQMNRTLSLLESKGIICRERSKKDKRQIFVFMNMNQAGAYQQLHLRVLKLVDGIIAEIGEKRASEAAKLMEELSAAADRLLHKQETQA